MVGMVAYSFGQGAVPATGHVLSDDDVRDIAANVQAILRDDTGVQEARDALADVAKTAFATEQLEQILAAPTSFDEWRVGEALAEHHLSAVLGCDFPWPDSRSTRNPNSSSGGVDLVGFRDDGRVRFVFAEVKTSHQQAWPPNVMTSRSHGLHRQITDLSAGDDRGRWAMRYLSMNAVGKPWLGKLRQAIETYLNDNSDVVIYGVLIHAADAREKDLHDRAGQLAESIEGATEMSLVAIYVTADMLRELADATVVLETAA